MSDQNPKNKLVKSSQWQTLRQSLIGKWKENPEWCCSQLRKYLGPISSSSKEKLDVIMNYLVGTGFRVGKIKHSCITKLRLQISMERKKRLVKIFNTKGKK